MLLHYARGKQIKKSGTHMGRNIDITNTQY
jgi:hypothetical protein